MSRGDKNLDKLFKDAFDAEEHEFVPAYWEEAQHMITASKVALTPFYLKPLFLIGTLVTVSASAVLFLVSTPKNDVITDNVPPTTQIESTTQKNIQTQPNIKSKQNQIAPPTSSTIEINNKKNLVSNSTSIATANPSSEISKTNAYAQNTGHSNANPLLVTQKSDPKYATVALQKKQTKNSSIIGSPSISSGPDESVTLKKSITATPAFINNELLGQKITLNILATREFNYIQEESDFSPLTKALPPSLGKIQRPLSIHASIGTNWSTDFTDSKSQITNSFKEQNIEIGVEYHFHKRWGVQAGVTFVKTKAQQQYAFQTEEDNSYWKEQLTVSPVENKVWWLGGWYYYPPTYDTAIGHILINDFDTINNKLQLSHYHKSIEVPLLITYNYGINRFNIQMSTGISLSTVIQTSGNYFISEDPFPQPISSASNFKGVQSSLLFRTEISYGINDQFWISARPQLKYQLNSIYPNNSTISPQLLYYGLNAGIVYRF